MFFAGHISIAFIISYLIVRRFQLKDISLPLLIFFSILPDIDIVFGLLGVDIGHRSITHSLLVSSIVWGILLVKYRKPSVILYFLAYLSHILIGDMIVGPLNILIPVGHYLINGVAVFKSPEHLAVEGVPVLIMATMVFYQYWRNRRIHVFPFGFTRLDIFFYPLVILAIIVSVFFLLDQFQSESTKFPNSVFLFIRLPIDAMIATIIVTQALCVAIISFLWIVSRRNSQIRYDYYQTTQKQQEK